MASSKLRAIGFPLERWPINMKNIQVIDGALNAVYDIFSATDEEFALIFPDGQDVAFIGEVQARGNVGKLDEALREANRAVELDPMGINSSAALGIAAHVALWMGDLDEVRGLLARMQRIRGRAMAAQRRTTQAGLAALEGLIPESVELYLDAIEAWRAVRSILDLALWS